MDKVNELELRYRRQFLLCREIIPELAHWSCLQLKGGVYVYSHPDLEVAYKEQEQIKILLLGYIFDSIDFDKDNEEILEDILHSSWTFSSFLKAIKTYVGQYVMIYINGSTLKVIHDPLGLRELYYCTSLNRIICGSQPNLIKKFSDPLLCITTDKSIQWFHDHDLKKSRSGRFWIGEATYYENIKHLLPNHFLDVATLKPNRYWPREKLVTLDFDTAVQRGLSFLRGGLRAAAQRHDLMMAVTSGIDSRTLLAASKDISGNIYYFINKHQGLDAGHPDIRVPSTMFNQLGIPFHIHNPQGKIDERFKEIFLNNTFMSTDLNLPSIYHVYFLNHSHRMNILGVGEIGRTFYGSEPRNIDGFYLARAMKFKNSTYAVEQCQRWLDSALPIAQKYGINTMTLLLWEQLLGNWGAVGNSESDIAIEEFDPFNSHYMYETLLAVDKKYAKYGESIIFDEMIRAMWPELLKFPFNPPYNKYDFVRTILTKSGIFAPLRKTKYWIDRQRFKLKRAGHS